MGASIVKSHCLSKPFAMAMGLGLAAIILWLMGKIPVFRLCHCANVGARFRLFLPN